mmetsp:Transcript_59111/g.93637  ORF Transcript_59111/g.93637 Transcript_59111/m.93637 type:complete len:489 (-) Transcript_59111:54-1520(-)
MEMRLTLAASRLLIGSWLLQFSLALDPQGGALQKFPPKFGNTTSFVDNFDFTNNATFEQRTMTFDQWWKPGNPILFFFGGEGSVENFYNASGAVFEHAQVLDALVVFLEHRSYGKSVVPKRALTVEQALADTAWFLSGLRAHLGCQQRECPIIVLGGSYGGMLVAWFRQKYPHLAAGGIASSAPIDFYPQDGRQEAFWNATLHTFGKYGLQSCPQELTEAMSQLKQKADTEQGRKEVAMALGSCQELQNETSAGAKADFFLRGVVATLAMLDYPVATNFVTPLPANPVKVACQRLHQNPGISGLRQIMDLFLNSTGGYHCYDLMAEVVGRPTEGHLSGPVKAPDMGHWQYQACNEMPMQSLTSDGMAFYPASDDQLVEVASTCQLRYGLTPRTTWLKVNFGGSDLQVGNLLFTNGEKDPWRVGAPKFESLLEGLDISQHLIPAGAHHEDLRFDSDPPKEAVSVAKAVTLMAMRRWIAVFKTGHQAIMI